MAFVTDALTAEGLTDTKSFRTQAGVQATANSTLTLTVASEYVQLFTGTTAGQILKLPDATTLLVGHRYEIFNNSSQPITINDNSSTLVIALPANQRLFLLLQANGTAAGTWTFISTSNIVGQPRYAITCGFDGSAATNRWMEVITNVASNVSPFVVPEAGTIKALSLAVQANATTTITIFKNGSSLTTITLSTTKTNSISGLNLALAAGDTLSAQVTSGSCNQPVLNIFVQVT